MHSRDVGKVYIIDLITQDNSLQHRTFRETLFDENRMRNLDETLVKCNGPGGHDLFAMTTITQLEASWLRGWKITGVVKGASIYELSTEPYRNKRGCGSELSGGYEINRG